MRKTPVVGALPRFSKSLIVACTPSRLPLLARLPPDRLVDEVFLGISLLASRPLPAGPLAFSSRRGTFLPSRRRGRRLTAGSGASLSARGRASSSWCSRGEGRSAGGRVVLGASLLRRGLVVVPGERETGGRRGGAGMSESAVASATAASQD